MEEENNISQFDIVKIAPSKMRDFFGAVIKLSENGTYHEPSCPLCSSKFRLEAEAIFLNTPQYDNNKFKAAKDFLDSKGECFSLDLIKNHFNNHINQGENQLRKIEYINTIDNIASVKMSTLEEIDFVVATLKDRLFESSKIVQDSKTSKIEAESVRANIVSQISKSISSFMKLRAELLGEMEKRGDVIVISREKFKQVINGFLDNTKTEDEKVLIVSLLKALSKVEDKSSL